MAGEPDLVQVMLRAALVIALIIPAMHLLRRLMGAGVGATQRRHLRVIESRGIGPGQVLHLVQVGDRHLLIAAHKEGVSMLSEVEIEVVEDEPVPVGMGRPVAVEALLARWRDSRPGRWLAEQTGGLSGHGGRT
jgi:flagellar biogenesis protein FliO